MRTLGLLCTLFALLCLSSCNKETSDKGEGSLQLNDIKPLVAEVLTREQQEALTPDEVLASFKEGNRRFVSNDLTARDHSALVRKSALGQFPKAVVISCLDSRVPVEDVFDRGIGDIFVGRVAGNFVNVDLLGSLEFACKVAGAKLVLIMGHEDCGAVMAAIDDVQLGNITAMLSNIRPAVEMTEHEGERNSSNTAFVEKVTQKNVLLTKEQVRKDSPILREMEDAGQIKIVGAVYNMTTGVVAYFE